MNNPEANFSCPIQIHRGRRGGKADAEDLKSSGGLLSCGFDSHRRHHDSKRQQVTNPDSSGSSVKGTVSKKKVLIRQEPTSNDSKRPPSATENATGLLPELPPDLAEVAAAWPDLPEPIRAGILAMIRSASGTGKGG